MIRAEIVLLAAFVALGLYAQFERHVGLENPFRLNELHHAFWLAPLVLVGSPWNVVALIGTYDDLGQHFFETFGVSPLHWLFGQTLWRIPWVRRVVAWLDRKLGKKA